MRQKTAAFIVRFRYPLMILFLILSALSVTTISGTRINYDLTSYLSEDTDTKKALAIMSSDFKSTSSMNVALIDTDDSDVYAFIDNIKRVPGVMSASFDPNSGVAYENGSTYRLVSIIMTADSAESILDESEALLNGVCHLTSGGAYENRVLRSSITGEMPLIMLIACAIVFVILLALTRAWIEPVLFFLVILVSILLNMGTNWIFPSISFITFAVCAILQLALAMDYSIMLINAFDRCRSEGKTITAAAEIALTGAFMPISSSALTTVAGMLALVFMSFTIGFDIGIVLAKGILFSMLTVFLFMPGLLTLFAPLLKKTAHKPISFKGDRTAAISTASRSPLPIILLVLILVGGLLSSNTLYTYTVRNTDADSQLISHLFGESNQIVLLFPSDTSDEGYSKQASMLQQMETLTYQGNPAVKEVFSMVTTGAAAVTYLNASDVAAMTGLTESSAQRYLSLMGITLPERGDRLLSRLSSVISNFSFMLPAETISGMNELSAQLSMANETFNGTRYSRALLSLDVPFSGKDAHALVAQIKDILHSYYGENCGLAGSLPATVDIATSFDGDMARVSLITIALVFLIIMISFRSLVIPALLICVIQGAIWINMAYSNVVDGSVFFMCYLICMALQMGATIDYGILLTNHYITSRASQSPRLAIAHAMKLSMQTILTSGLAMIIAGFTVGRVSTVFYISSIGTLLGRGAFISIVLVLFLLPRLLLWLDRFIVKNQSND